MIHNTRNLNPPQSAKDIDFNKIFRMSDPIYTLNVNWRDYYLGFDRLHGGAPVIYGGRQLYRTGAMYSLTDYASHGQSNMRTVVGSRSGAPALWSYVRTDSTWISRDPSFIYGEDVPTALTGVGVSANIAPGYAYTGYRTSGETKWGAIWLRLPE